MRLLADQVEFRLGFFMAGEAVAAELVDHFVRAAHADRGARFRDIEFKELPVLGRRIVAGLALDHGFARHELHDRARRIYGAGFGGGGGNRAVQIAEQVVDIEAAHRMHVADAFERGGGRLEDGRRGRFHGRRFHRGLDGRRAGLSASGKCGGAQRGQCKANGIDAHHARFPQTLPNMDHVETQPPARKGVTRRQRVLNRRPFSVISTMIRDTVPSTAKPSISGTVEPLNCEPMKAPMKAEASVVAKP